MSSSPSRAPVTEDAKEMAAPVTPAAPFSYSEAVLLAGQRNFPLVPPGKTEARGEGNAVPLPNQEAVWREFGQQEGAAESRVKFDAQVAAERARIAQAVADFALERAAYYRTVEAEAVRLALSIARKILHREAQTDPWLLMGIVKVALEKIEGAMGVELRVHPQRAAEWRVFLAAQKNLAEVPAVIEDAAVAGDQCVLRTQMGTADLGLEGQLREIEQGLMDLLAARPQQS